MSPWTVLIGTLAAHPPREAPRSCAARQCNLARGERTRQNVLAQLGSSERSTAEMAARCNLSNDRVLRILREFKAAGKVTARRGGTAVYYWRQTANVAH